MRRQRSRSACRTSARRRRVDNSTSLIKKEIVMTGINTGKVVAAGLLAGLVANAFDFVTNTYILAADWQALATAHNMDPAAMTSPAVAGTWIAVDFLFGLLLVWTYAAIRPRLGAG